MRGRGIICGPRCRARISNFCARSLSRGSYFFCHDGVRPGVPLKRRSEDYLLWIRNEFLGSGTDFGKIIARGHTPVPEPEALPKRIGVDTGAFATGGLTCVALDGGAPRFLCVF
jgi:serine/threonine protein phosphatase 1